MRRAPSILAIVALAVVPARAGDAWQVDDAETVQRNDEYDQAMADGDDAALLAASGSTSPPRLRKLVNAAARAYERAAAARPDLAEPRWRAANVLFGFLVDCDAHDPGAPLCLGRVDVDVYRRILANWAAFEAADPLDPRLRTILFERAVMYTKLATDADLRLAVADYERHIDWHPDRATADIAPLGNLAEVFMMLGDVDRSLDAYKRAVQLRPRTSIIYGLAVAYDRDGQGAIARELIRGLGATSFEEWRGEVAAGDTFYVPDGEVFYYYALAYEALGRKAEAITAWQRFVDSGAHPPFQPRARDNLAALKAKK
jgi:tetratricopeptide (TPR) repeat protein